MALYQLGNEIPSVAGTAWVADSAQVIGAVEADARLHQHAGRRHLPQERPHGRRMAIARRAPPQHLLPVPGESHDHAAHRHAVEDEALQFAHLIFFRPARKRRAFST